MSKQNVSRTMRRSVSGSISSPKKASATRQAIRWRSRRAIPSKNASGSRSIRTGIYSPLSGAMLATTASRSETSGVRRFVL